MRNDMRWADAGPAFPANAASATTAIANSFSSAIPNVSRSIVRFRKFSFRF
jgi:hypothetical protein